MDYKYQIGLAAVGGAALDRAQYVRAMARYGAMIEAQINQDCWSLGALGTMADIPPPSPASTRKPANPLVAAILAALATGAVFGAAVAFLVIAITVIGGGNTGQGVIGGIFFGLVVAVAATLVPGAFVALVVQRRAAGKQYAAEAYSVLLAFHHYRDAIRRDLEAGNLDSFTAAQRVAALMSQ